MGEDLRQCDDGVLIAEIERRGHRVVLGGSLEQAFGLTKKQAKVLRFVRERYHATGVGPTLDEICEHMGGRMAKSSAHAMLTGLVERGAIRRLARKKRAIMPVGATSPDTILAV